MVYGRRAGVHKCLCSFEEERVRSPASVRKQQEYRAGDENEETGPKIPARIDVNARRFTIMLW